MVCTLSFIVFEKSENKNTNTHFFLKPLLFSLILILYLKGLSMGNKNNFFFIYGLEQIPHPPVLKLLLFSLLAYWQNLREFQN